LKHADEIQGSEEMLAVPRTLYDGIRAVEPAYQRGDWPTYLRRLKGKLPKFRKAAEYYAAHFKEFSPHTNFEMAALSLQGVVRAMEDVFADVVFPPPTAPEPEDDLEIPDV
jgi:hypothetical protein